MQHFGANAFILPQSFHFKITQIGHALPIGHLQVFEFYNQIRLADKQLVIKRKKRYKRSVFDQIFKLGLYIF